MAAKTGPKSLEVAFSIPGIYAIDAPNEKIKAKKYNSDKTISKVVVAYNRLTKSEQNEGVVHNVQICSQQLEKGKVPPFDAWTTIKFQFQES